MHSDVVEDSIGKARQAQGWFERLVASRHRPSCSPMMEAEARSSRIKARYVFRWKSQATRAQDERLCVLPDSSSRKELVESSSRAQNLPIFLPSCLPFVSALCTLRGTSGSCLHRPSPDGIRELDSPPSSPVAPPEPSPSPPRPDYTSYSEGFSPPCNIYGEVKGFSSC